VHQSKEGIHKEILQRYKVKEEPINFIGRGVYRFLSEKLVNLLGCKLKLPSKDSLFVKQ
jgi:hypothetical protein